MPCGFVVFASPVHAEQCVQELNGKPNGTGNKYVARFAKAPETKAQRKRSGSRDMKRTAPDAIHNTPLVSAGHSMLLYGHTMNTAHRFYRSDTPSCRIKILFQKQIYKTKLKFINFSLSFFCIFNVMMILICFVFVLQHILNPVMA